MMAVLRHWYWARVPNRLVVEVEGLQHVAVGILYSYCYFVEHSSQWVLPWAWQQHYFARVTEVREHLPGYAYGIVGRVAADVDKSAMAHYVMKQRESIAHDRGSGNGLCSYGWNRD